MWYLNEREHAEHQLKVLPEYFEAVVKDEKTFELRKDDRGYQVGDFVTLLEWDGENFTGRRIGMVKIRYILRNCPEYGLMNGYCILGF